ncbi:MAG: hypothetical protein CMP10_21705 [Zetaproteobacteria bacterium]|nr:hypothetical protein [Pseudobdellovibrionaceae bacterium]|tara:strand:+ start:1080 stop:2159 length:1080 start_codon:yes stop_codon:yes gene_type:complete
MIRCLIPVFVLTILILDVEALGQEAAPYGDRENQYEQFFDQKIRPFWKTATTKIVQSHDGKDLAYRVYPSNPAHGKTIGNILIVHGWCEGMPKYSETIWDFNNAGYNVVIYEQRGHGYSYRETDKKGVGHVMDFGSYIKDVNAVASQLLDPELPRLLLGHSMGGLISLGALQQYPDLFKAALINVPMLETKYPMPGILAKPLLAIWCFGNDEDSFGPFQKAPPPVPYKFNKWSGTGSEARFKMVENQLVEEGYDQQRRIKGASCAWAKTTITYQEEINAKESIAKIKIPVLMTQAGQDEYVKPEAQNRFCSELEECRLIRFDKSRHEIYRSKDESRKRWLTEAIAFFNQFTEQQSKKIQ